MSKPFNVRLEDDMRKAIDAQVATDGVDSASTWAREAFAGVIRLGGLPALAEAIERGSNKRSKGASSKVAEPEHLSPHPKRAIALQRRPQAGARQKPKTTEPASDPDCAHANEKKLPYMTVCADCGGRIR